MKKDDLTQPQRILSFFINSLIFYGVYVGVTGHWNVTGSGETLWLASAIAWWTLGLLSAPWYRPPRDALGAAIAAITGLFTLDISTATALKPELEALRILSIAYAAIVGIAALIAASIEQNVESPLKRFSYNLAERLSSGPMIFGTLALISIFGFYQNRDHILLLTLLWLGFALIKPVELAFALREQWKTEKAAGDHIAAGTILRVDDPNIVRVSIQDAESWDNNLHVACLAGTRHRYVLPLFSHIQNELIIGTGLIVTEAPNSDFPNVVGLVVSIEDDETRSRLIREQCGEDEDAQIVGFVVEGSQISDIRFEVAKNAGLEEGSVVFCVIENKCVFYQIFNASTAEESFHQNPRGTHIVHANQMGIWSPKNGFEKFPWLPPMNALVLKLPNDREYELELNAGEFAIGAVPGTAMQVKASLPDLVGYHTAILGVTGTGKTELVLDLVREAISQGTKVFCVDLTGEYRKRLEDLSPKAIGLQRNRADQLEQKLLDIDFGSFGSPQEKKALNEFMVGIRSIAADQVSQFLREPGSDVGLFELAEVTNTRATLLATEIYLTEIMLWARSHRKARRILIVLEEAHTIIPETAGAGFGRDTQAVVNKIGQIALQGRKYGVGLFVVSQRTALVSKTILSQCNTFLTHSLVDQTSLQFLLNIYDSSYVGSIPNLRFLHFLAFGKGIRSQKPLLLNRPLDENKAAASAALDEFIDINEEIPADEKTGSGERAVAAAKAAPKITSFSGERDGAAPSAAASPMAKGKPTQQ